MFLLGLALMFCSFGFFMLYGVAGPFIFVDLPSLLILVWPLVAVLIATQSFNVFYEGLRAAAFPKTEISEEMRGRAASLFRLLSKTTAMAAAIGILIPFIQFLAEMDFSDVSFVSKLARNISVALITPLYALILIVAVFEPVVFILKKRYTGRR